MYCSLLENHIYINVRGRYQTCCVSTDNMNEESITNCTPKQWWSSDRIRSSVEMMKNNQWPEQCSNCKNAEEKGLESDRLAFENRFGPEAVSLDLRFSTSCNLKCISCGPTSSSSIAEEHNQMVNAGLITGPIYENNNWFTLSNIEPLMALPIKEVKFAGGEPMMIKHITEMLEMLDPSVIVKFTTNMTLFNPKVFELMKKFKKVIIAASIDAIGKKIEYIRYGSDWQTIEKNISKYSEVAEIHFGVCVTSLNAMYLDEIKDWAKEKNFKNLFYPATEPKWLSIKHAPKIIQECVPEFKSLVSEGDNQSYIQAFQKNIRRLDSLRNVNIRDYLPEVADAYGM